MKSIGVHLMWDIHKVESDIISYEKDIAPVMEHIISLTTLSIENYSSKQFEPVGVTSIYLLSESHLSIHTWPEHGYLAIDLFSCVPIESDKITEYLKTLYQSEDVKMTQVMRGKSREMDTK